MGILVSVDGHHLYFDHLHFDNSIPLCRKVDGRLLYDMLVACLYAPMFPISLLGYLSQGWYTEDIQVIVFLVFLCFFGFLPNISPLRRAIECQCAQKSFCSFLKLLKFALVKGKNTTIAARRLCGQKLGNVALNLEEGLQNFSYLIHTRYALIPR